MGFFKKRFEKNVSRDNEFLKSYAVKVNGLLFYTGDNEKVSEELCALMNDFQYTMASSKPEAKKVEKSIESEFDVLSKKFQQPDWADDEVILSIRNIRRYIIEIGSLR